MLEKSKNTQHINVQTLEFDIDKIKEIQDEYINNYPVVYILNGNNEVYIGQTVRFKLRMKEHLKIAERKKLDKTTVISSAHFHQSATDNLESNLINYIFADGKYKLQNISKMADKTMHEYYRKKYYHQEVFSEVWEELYKREIVSNKLEKIRDKDIFKLSPFKELSDEQYEMKNKILEFCEQNVNVTNKKKSLYLVEGGAGTGKSVLLSSLFNRLQILVKEESSNLYNKKNYLLVNHPEMLKTYENIANKLPNMKKNSILKPTKFINDVDKKKINKEDIGVVIIDEAHLLLTRTDKFNNFNYENHLEEIIKRAAVTIIIYDQRQSLRIKGMWDEEILEKVIGNCNLMSSRLKQQYRIDASDSTYEWIDSFVNKKLLPIPKDKKYDLRIYDNVIEMHNDIKEKNEKEGLSRILSTFDYQHKKDGEDYYITIGDFKLPWNRVKDNNINWSEREETIDEVGSTYTIQGFDLNYAGVILGPSIDYDEEKDEIVVNTGLWKDVGAFSGSNQYKNKKEKEEQLIMNAINVLIKRGIKGLYIYAVNEKLRNRLKSLMPCEQ